jgi:hypothetical protein
MSIGVEVHWAAEGGEPERPAVALTVVDVLVAPSPGPYRRLQTRPRRSAGPTGWEAPMSFAARPGTGGRRPWLQKGFETEATRELLAELGDPHTDTYKGTRLDIWQVSDEPGGAARRDVA